VFTVRSCAAHFPSYDENNRRVLDDEAVDNCVVGYDRPAGTRDAGDARSFSVRRVTLEAKIGHDKSRTGRTYSGPRPLYGVCPAHVRRRGQRDASRFIERVF